MRWGASYWKMRLPLLSKGMFIKYCTSVTLNYLTPFRLVYENPLIRVRSSHRVAKDLVDSEALWFPIDVVSTINRTRFVNSWITMVKRCAVWSCVYPTKKDSKKYWFFNKFSCAAFLTFHRTSHVMKPTLKSKGDNCLCIELWWFLIKTELQYMIWIL